MIKPSVQVYQHLLRDLWTIGCHFLFLVVYYESIKRELKNECRYDERLKTKVEESTLVDRYTPRIHWVVRRTGTPKDKDEVNRRDVSECDG